MAGFNEIQTGRFNRMLQKILSMKGPASMNELSTTLQSVVVVGQGVEARYLEGWDRYAIEVGLPALAANITQFRFRNPAGSNIISVIEKMNACLPAGSIDQVLYQGGPTVSDLANVGGLGTGARVDARTQRAASSMILSNQQTAAVSSFGSNRGVCFLLADTTYDFIINENQEITVLPGDAVQLNCIALNTGLNCAFWWRERLMEDSERS